jgi:RimJ/RimL family protein N-acetyltransferase
MENLSILNEVSTENNSDIDQQPTLQTQHLILRPFNLFDAPEVQRLAGDRDIAAMTLLIPHPYADGMAEEWIKAHPKAFEEGISINFAVVLRKDEKLCGAIGLGIDKKNSNAELGYWIGKPYWGRGYCTEAAKAILKYGFEVIGLNRIYATHFPHNPASGRVMQKIGMRYEGCLRQHIHKWGKFEDVWQYGILKSEWLGTQRMTKEQ